VRRALALAVSLALFGCADVFDPKVGELRNANEYADASTDADLLDGSTQISFEYDIRPLMNRSETDPSGHGCKFCHYAGQGSQLGLLESGLELTNLGTLRRGGTNASAQDTGQHPIIDTKNPENSAIVQKLRGTFFHGVRMPRNGPPYWSDEEIALVVRWIEQGAKGDDDE
jgi:hypothetical protein